MKAKIMDFSLRGLVRIVFKPIVNEIPLIGGVQVQLGLLKCGQVAVLLACACPAERRRRRGEHAAT